MDFIPYKANECFEHLYYQIPMELFFNTKYKDKLNSDSKILYGFLLNRLTLSAKNNWIDENGSIFLIFTRKEVQTLLNLSDKTATKAFRQLKEYKLIDEKRIGKGKTYKIYVGKINRKNSDLSTGNFTTELPVKVRHSKNNNIYNKRNNWYKPNFEQRHYDNLDYLYANKRS